MAKESELVVIRGKIKPRWTIIGGPYSYPLVRPYDIFNQKIRIIFNPSAVISDFQEEFYAPVIRHDPDPSFRSGEGRVLLEFLCEDRDVKSLKRRLLSKMSGDLIKVFDGVEVVAEIQELTATWPLED